MSEESTPEERRALFRVVRGEPDDAEAAALTVVLAALSAATPAPTTAKPPSRWTDRATHLRHALPVGPNAWRTSTWPS